MPESETDKTIGRRTFVTAVVGLLTTVIAAIVGLPAIGYWIAPALQKTRSDAWVPLAPLEKIPVDTPTLFSFTRTKVVGWERTATSYGVFAWVQPGGAVVTFSNVCTHLSCRVSWKAEGQDYVCPCHDGHFAKDGSVLSGPPPRPLDRFQNKVEDGTLFVHVVES